MKTLLSQYFWTPLATLVVIAALVLFLGGRCAPPPGPDPERVEQLERAIAAKAVESDSLAREVEASRAREQAAVDRAAALEVRHQKAQALVSVQDRTTLLVAGAPVVVDPLIVNRIETGDARGDALQAVAVARDVVITQLTAQQLVDAERADSTEALLALERAAKPGRIRQAWERADFYVGILLGAIGIAQLAGVIR